MGSQKPPEQLLLACKLALLWQQWVHIRKKLGDPDVQSSASETTRHDTKSLKTHTSFTLNVCCPRGENLTLNVAWPHIKPSPLARKACYVSVVESSSHSFFVSPGFDGHASSNVKEIKTKKHKNHKYDGKSAA